MSVTNFKITAVNQLAFEVGSFVLPVSCILGELGVFFGQKDSGFRSIILKNVKWPAEK